MSQQELDELDKIIEEIIIFGSVDYSNPDSCSKEAEKHNKGKGTIHYYIYHSLMIRKDDKLALTRQAEIDSLRRMILNGYWEED